MIQEIRPVVWNFSNLIHSLFNSFIDIYLKPRHLSLLKKTWLRPGIQIGFTRVKCVTLLIVFTKFNSDTIGREFTPSYRHTMQITAKDARNSLINHWIFNFLSAPTYPPPVIRHIKTIASEFFSSPSSYYIKHILHFVLKDPHKYQL